MKILTLIIGHIASWWKDNTAETYIDKGFYSQQALDDFILKTNEVIKWCISARTLEHIDTIDKYFKRYLHYANHTVSPFILEMNLMCHTAISKAKHRISTTYAERVICNALNGQNPNHINA